MLPQPSTHKIAMKITNQSNKKAKNFQRIIRIFRFQASLLSPKLVSKDSQALTLKLGRSKLTI